MKSRHWEASLIRPQDQAATLALSSPPACLAPETRAARSQHRVTNIPDPESGDIDTITLGSSGDGFQYTLTLAYFFVHSFSVFGF